MKKTKFRSLTVTLADAFLALSAAVLLIASALQMYFNFQVQRDVIISQQQLVAKEAANTVRNFVQEKLDVLKTAAGVGNLIASSEQERKPVLEKLLGYEPSFRQTILFDAQGQELLRNSRLSSLLSGQLEGQIKQNKDELFSRAGRGKAYISLVYIDEITSEPMVIIAVPVMNVFGDFKGVLLTEVNLKFMWDLVGSIKVGKTGTAYVVDKRGNLIAFGDISRVLKGENLICIEEVARFVNGAESPVASEVKIVKGIQNTYVLDNHVPLGMPDWAVVVELPVWEAYKPVFASLKLTILAMLVSFALALVAGVHLARRITKPIIDLRNAAGQIGEGRMDARIAVKSQDEIGQLAASFNQMVDNLKRTTTSIDNLNREIDERKKAERRQAQLFEELKKTNKELSDFAYITSHDLKAPLRGIATLANWISTDYADKLDEQGRKQISLLISRVTRMHKLIDGILQYSRIGRVKEEKVVLNLNELVSEAIDMIAPPASITITVENELPVIKCEKTRVMQIFGNLISNAVKYMDKPQGRIKVGCVEENGFWKFSVADNGPGIEEKYFEKIFQMFQTLSHCDDVESTGIGLSLVKKIVGMYDGEVWVESQPGKGSTFFFTLPKQETGVKNEELQANIVG